MHAAITVDKRLGFLRFQFDRLATVSDWKEAQAAFLRLSEETGIRRALVDLRQQATAGSHTALFEFGRNLPSAGVFAVLSSPESGDHVFVETVALNRGKNVRLFFGAEEDAIKWLVAQAA